MLDVTSAAGASSPCCGRVRIRPPRPSFPEIPGIGVTSPTCESWQRGVPWVGSGGKAGMSEWEGRSATGGMQGRVEGPRSDVPAESGADVVFLVMDPRGTILRVSASATARRAFRPDELIGHSGYDFIYPDDVADLARAHATLLEHRAPVTCGPYRARRKGGWAWIENTLRPAPTRGRERCGRSMRPRVTSRSASRSRPSSSEGTDSSPRRSAWRASEAGSGTSTPTSCGGRTSFTDLRAHAWRVPAEPRGVPPARSA